MRKIKFCLASVMLAAALLSGCGMARDGYIEDLPAQTPAPLETPFVTITPKPTKNPAENGMADPNLAEETPLPNAAEQTAGPNM